jgi:hypothetical protein
MGSAESRVSVPGKTQRFGPLIGFVSPPDIR